MFPGVPKWATNALFTGGPDVGSPTKAKPSSGQEDEGYERLDRPAAQRWNFWRWAIASLSISCASSHVANWEKTDTSVIDLVTSAMPEVAAYDSAQDTWWVVAAPGPVAAEELYSVGGLTNWAGAAAGPWAGLVLPRDCDVDPAGVRAVTFFDAADLIYTTPAGYPGVYVLWAGLPGPGLIWEKVAHDHIGLWVFADQNGVLYNSTGPAVAVAPVAVGPGFAAAIPIALEHSRHAALDVWDQDPGNPVWLAMTATEISTSADGLSWTPAALHGIPTPARGLAYSKPTTKWGIIEGTAGNAQFHYSTDNGLTWTAGAVIDATFGAISNTHLQCDGFGHWVAVIADAVISPKIYASADDGDTWYEIHMPATWPPAAGAILNSIPTAYGGGRFMIFTGDNAGLPPGNTFNFFASNRYLG